MPIVATLSDHFKYQMFAGNAPNLLPFNAGLSVTFDNSPATITRGAGSFITDGWKVGDRVHTDSVNAANVGAFVITNLSATVMTVANLDGSTVTFTTGTETRNLMSAKLKILLMRNGFVFDKTKHGKITNIKTNSGSIANLTFNAGAYTAARGAGSFLTDGFVVGNQITTNSANGNNQGPFLISAISGDGLTLTLTTTAGGNPTLTAGTENNVTVTSNDELATGFGYTQDTQVLGQPTLTEDDVNNYGNVTFATQTWSASGGSIGPTPQAIIYNDTANENTIVGGLDFGGNQTATTGTTFNIAGITLRGA